MGDSGFLPVDTPVPIRGLLLGLLLSIFCLGQFFSGPILGALSDRKGRKKILCLTLIAGSLSYIVGAISLQISSLALLMIARLVNGVSAGNFAIAQSMIADCSEGTDRTKKFGLVGMAWGVGFILGPYLGGELAHVGSSLTGGLTLPFWFSAALCAINLGLASAFLRESMPKLRATPLTLLGGVRDLKRAFNHPTLRGIFIITFIFSLGWGFFTEFAALFLMDRFSFQTREIGHFYAYAGCWVAICQGVLIRPFLKRFSPHQLLKGAFFFLGLMLLTFLTSTSSFVLLIAVPLIAMPEALVYPNTATLVSTLSRPEEQGEMLGIHNSIQWAAIGLIPFFSGSLVALYPHLPITVASSTMFIAFIALLILFKKQPVSILDNKTN